MSLCTPHPVNSLARPACGPPAIRSKCAVPAACLRPRAVRDQVTRLRCGVFQTDREQTLSKSDRGRRVDKVVQLIKHVDALVPFDPETFNAALTIWKAVADTPSEDRVKLLGRLSAEDIMRLWTLAGGRYKAAKVDRQVAEGIYSPWDDLPSEPNQTVVFKGKPAITFSWLFGFSKVFFLHPQTSEVYGRVQLQKGPVGNALYPLYYKAFVQTSFVPGESAPADMSLEYLHPIDLGLTTHHVPKGWPEPKAHKYPFDGGLIDYCRVVGPGVLVGKGLKAPTDGGKVGNEFVHFLLVKV